MAFLLAVLWCTLFWLKCSAAPFATTQPNYNKQTGDYWADYYSTTASAAYNHPTKGYWANSHRSTASPGYKGHTEDYWLKYYHTDAPKQNQETQYYGSKYYQTDSLGYYGGTEDYWAKYYQTCLTHQNKTKGLKNTGQDIIKLVGSYYVVPNLNFYSQLNIYQITALELKTIGPNITKLVWIAIFSKHDISLKIIYSALPDYDTVTADYWANYQQTGENDYDSQTG
ncbi:hypothetical protein HELRODRAFT_177724 [Helobdella robusta]|uniref:Uncharacterized protein n=1 Tax=Helobdella robusta TaxID=6412 RepID=T1FC49_HELRO|nr:hypothetical protein HELRODRAFT_177724 [Helobdella robusta]ESN97669.1 hypothetical protein HELRODRAFT_177724 [Helobdella robusta]